MEEKSFNRRRSMVNSLRTLEADVHRSCHGNESVARPLRPLMTSKTYDNVEVGMAREMRQPMARRMHSLRILRVF